MVSNVLAGIARIHVPVGRGCSFQAKKGEFVAVMDINGHQCADFWAIDANDFGHYLSPPYTIVHICSLQPRVGDALVTNRREPILTVVADDVGWHDLLYPACDSRRYEIYFGVKGHRSCRDNFLEATAGIAWGDRAVPNPPFNIFMNSSVQADGTVVVGEPRSKAGDKIILRAEMDIVGVVSSCPMDLTPTGGKGDLLVLVGKDIESVKSAAGGARADRPR